MTPPRIAPRGQAMVEALLVLALIVVALGFGPASPLEQCIQALQQFLAAYTLGVSRP